MTQTIVDRCILDEIYKFIVYILPCTFPEDQPKLLPRKRKTTHSEEINSTFLTPMASQGPIILTPTSEDSIFDGKNYNLNNSSPLWRTFLNLKQGGSPARSLSGSPSPIALLERRLSGEGIPSAKRIAPEMLPKSGRPRSKSTATDKPKSKTLSRARSRSSDQTNKHSSKDSGSSTFTPITSTALNSNSNSNNNNSNVSPPSGGMLAIPMTHFRPLPITPPRNPYEDQPVIGRQLDPKTLRHLQLK